MNSLLPSGSSPLEKAAAIACQSLQTLPVPLRQLWNASTCPVDLLPYLAWAWSVDRWDENWSEPVKRQVVRDSMFIHRHKGTIGALKRVVEPLGYIIKVTEWWQTDDPPGTFRLDVGVQENGISQEIYDELERLIADARPVSRHLLGLSINLDSQGEFYLSAATFSGDELTVYPYFAEEITVSGAPLTAVGVHIIDKVEVAHER
ncbi:phage tail protein I [Proteus mirabilis]|uniref:phage tail protein I n=2 Tax=Proteus mirabilis TaxID=584 RepID=UPI000C12A156|nr:phage tail protein I [Proteus mirabilis]MBI6206205.1 phage tail protein I [Proteus mirabilis]MBI6373734.1 phage tail protein I [Proteus mirabilis]MCT0098844.1 phage tail protein I [Proteus mirabilis]MDL2098299.1 phage tail protein I [Proteus mirabilis]HEI9866945.1 phage tail protein I [Proteus mirabilis]